jgi:hypothetical protein
MTDRVGKHAENKREQMCLLEAASSLRKALQVQVQLIAFALR